ncbi:MAG: hypothetical protein E7434_02820 [Ruminococcaceae bacterium]|nr:hypothetical protein [Oscillospiraceae bacterium]
MKKIPIWKNVTLIISVIVMIIIATFAWFYTGTRGSADDMSVHVGKAYYIQISGDQGNNWSDDLDVHIGVNKNFKEISGDGTNFYKPVYDLVGNDDDGYSTQLISFEKLTDANKSEYYYEEILEFRSDIEQEIYLAPESYVVDPEAEDDQINNYISGAIRIAFFEINNGKEELKYIWAPNSQIEYSAEDSTFRSDGTVEPYYCYQVGTAASAVSANISTEATDEAGCGYHSQYKFMWSNGQQLPEDAPCLLKLDTIGEDNHFHKTMKVKVWLEGYDRECVSQLSGQKFTIKLEFAAKEENSDE